MRNPFTVRPGERPGPVKAAASYLIVCALVIGFFWLSLLQVGVALDFGFVAQYHVRILDGLLLTVQIAVGSLVASLAIGLPVAVGQGSRILPVRYLCDVYVKLMRGKPKTSITLTIARKGVAKPIVIKLMRDIIKIQSVKSKSLGDGLAYIRISQFQERTATDVADALMKLNKEKPLKGVVLDLRNNSGGLLNSAIGVSAAFIKPGSLVVSTRGRNPEDERKFNAVEKDYATGKSSQDNISHLPEITKTVPVVVLINSASASASEIVAGALQDHKRATIMGTRSFGKGSVQTIIPIRMKKDQTTGVKITTARYYTPSGRTIQATGITPDIAVDDTPEGNYPSFSIREAELAHHLEVKEEKKVEQKNGDKPEVKKDDKSAVQKDKNKKAAEEFVDEEETTMPKLRYMFGDEKDFPLQQAKAFLKGEHVVTHEETQAKLKADRDKKKAEQAAKDKKQNKAQSKNTTETEKK